MEVISLFFKFVFNFHKYFIGIQLLEVFHHGCVPKGIWDFWLHNSRGLGWLLAVGGRISVLAIC